MRLSANNPYPGIRPFGEKDAAFFFGREDQVAAVVRRVLSHRFVAVVGASGSGKSSLVRAGLIPALRKRGSPRWRCVTVRPEAKPFENLVRVLHDATTEGELTGEIDRLRLGGLLYLSSDGLAEAVSEMNLAPDERMLVIIDQFEELIRFDQETVDTSLRFIGLLLRAAEQNAVPVNILITMRLDFMADCARYTGLTEHINEGQYLVPALDRYQRTTAIVKPAEKAGAEVAWPLVQTLLNDADDAHDQLPVLQHGLMRLWDAAGSDQRPNLDHYRDIGKLSGAIANHADKILNDLRPPEDNMAERLFKALTELDKQARGIRRPQTLRDICASLGIRGEDEKLQRSKEFATLVRVIEKFRAPPAFFLMPSVPETLTPDSFVDISHESLIRQWPQISGDQWHTGWLQEEARDGQRYTTLVDDALNWKHERFDPPGGEKLRGYVRMLARPGLNAHWGMRYLTPDQREKFDGSPDRVDSLVGDLMRVAKRQAGRKRLFRYAAGALAVITSVFFVASVSLQYQKEELKQQTAFAEIQRERAEIQRVIAERERDLALTKGTFLKFQEDELADLREMVETQRDRVDEALVAERNLGEELARANADLSTLRPAVVCPAVTVADSMGVAAGTFPQQYELSEFEAAANCTLTFQENPAIGDLNARIRGNPALPPLAERLPEEPLVVAPYNEIGRYGGVFDVLSNATEAGTSDFLSVRHVNLVRYSDDLQTVVPNIARDWQWNDDFTQLTFTLRKGHRWSDGAPFTADDVKYWYDNLALNPDVISRPKDYVLVSGERMDIVVLDPQTVQFNLPAPKPGLIAHFATSFAQGFQPRHFLSKWDPKLNADADAMAQAAGFENGLAVIAAYYGNTDWMDSPSPLLNSPGKVANLPADVVPTLESHIFITDTTEGRHLVANPYFHMVDTAGNQLPYISEQDEVYINENEVRILKLVNAEVDYKEQSLQLDSAPLLIENQEKGDYTIDLRPEITISTFAFNVTSEDPEKRKVFGDLRFRQAMSVAINRQEINEFAYFGLGEAKQYVGFSPAPAFVDAKWSQHFTQYDPALANSLLDEVGMKDTDGDGFRELPNGDKIVLNLQFSIQGIPSSVVELVGQHWSDVGVQTTAKEVTSDVFRSAQSSNWLDVTMWRKSQPLAIVLGNNELWVPPFSNYFGGRNGMLWAEWVYSDGAIGVEPPDYVKQMIADIDAFQSSPAGSAESDALGTRLVENMVGNLLFIGVVQAPAPIYHRNALKNFRAFRTHSYEYYRAYPYRGMQWFLDDES